MAPWFLNAFCIVVLSSLCHAHDRSKVHNCVHDKIQKKHSLRSQAVKYLKHPFEQLNAFESINATLRRQLVEDADYEPIRISPYYDPATISTSNGLTIDEIAHIEHLVSASIRHFESFLRVIPVEDALFVSPCEYSGYSTGDTFLYSACSSEQVSGMCGSDASIPAEHLMETWVYDPYTSESTQYNQAGAGINNTDLVIYVTYGDTTDCGDSTLAYAVACNQDQYGRPVAGAINFCASAIQEQYWKFDVVTTMHELTHILAMSSGLFPSFYDYENGVFQSDVTVLDDANYWVVTDKVKEVAIEHFGCSSLIGAPLENSGGTATAGSHWEGKYLNYEYMDGTIYSAQSYLSKFTLALMEDSQWYKVDWDYAEAAYSWGKDAGCDFFTDECIDSSTSVSNFAQFWCDSSGDHGCSADYSSRSICWVYSVTPPAEFKYYTDNVAGPESHDYCGFRNPETFNTDFEYVCWDTRGNTLDSNSIGSSIYGVDSRCVQVTTDSSSQNGYCFAHACTGWDAANLQYSGVDITVNSALNEVISCSRSDALTTKNVSTVSGLQSITCPNIDAVCGSSTKPFECYFGTYSDALSQCVCSPGYMGDTCDTEDDTELVAEASLADGLPAATTHDGVCIAGMTGEKRVFNGYYARSGLNDGIEAFYNSSINGGTYLFYLRAYSDWSLSSSKGSQSRFASCDVALGMYNDPNIEECENWYVLSGGQFVEQSSVIAMYDVEECDAADALWTSRIAFVVSVVGMVMHVF